MMFAPIALFTYKRLHHVKQTIDALRRNVLAGESELIIFSDGPRSEADGESVVSVREYLRTVSGFGEIEIVEREKNLGLARSIISGVTEIVNRHGRVIVLEDDMVTSPFFLRYMNDGLEFYQDEKRVVSIHGYLYPMKATLPETFFLRGADCWGWATWKRGWDLFEPDGAKLLRELRARHEVSSFDVNGSYPFTAMLRRQMRGSIDSWAIRWHASAFLADKLTLYPGRSLIANIGLDASGSHCSPTDQFDVAMSSRQVDVGPIPLEEHAGAKMALERYFRETRPSAIQTLFRRILRKCSAA